jgi:hypothetical protein
VGFQGPGYEPTFDLFDGAPWGLPKADPKGAVLLEADPPSWDVPAEHPGRPFPSEVTGPSGFLQWLPKERRSARHRKVNHF